MNCIWQSVGSFNTWDLVCPLLLSVFLGSCFRAWLLHRHCRPHPNNPTYWPVLGMLPALLHNFHHMYDWCTPILINNGGNFMFHGPWLSGMRYFFTADPRNVEHALRTNFPNYTKGEEFSKIFENFLGDGIFSVDGHLWQKQRKDASLLLNSLSCKQHMDFTVFKMVDTKLIPTLHHFCKERNKVDFQDLMLRFTFDTICAVVFGVDTGCLSPDLPAILFANALETALECCILRFALPPRWWRVLRWLRLGKERHMPNAIKVLNKFCEDAISVRKQQFEHDRNDNQGDLLSCCLKMGDEISHDGKSMRDMACSILLAGRETSALALTWFFWLLSKHPEVEERVVQEARHVIDMAKEEGNLVLTRKQLNSMHYLHAALTESLRLYPSVPVDIKHVVKDDILPDGNRLRGGDKFVYNIYIMGRMESIWGPDSSSFRPERWIRMTDGTFTDACVPPFFYLPFNAGPRTCLGKDMAYSLMKAVASTLLYHFRVKVVAGQKVAPKLSITLYMRNGLLVTLEPRDA